MSVALKLYASLADYLPPEARKTHRLELDLAAGTTIAAVIAAQFTPLPPNPADNNDKTPPTVTIAFTGAS